MQEEEEVVTAAGASEGAAGHADEGAWAMAEHRPMLLRVAYRMLGSMQDAEDAVQEALVRAWRAREGFEGRSAVSTWLCRITTRVCLDMAARRTRTLPPEVRPSGSLTDDLDMRSHEAWIEPVADAWCRGATDPVNEVSARESVSLAWMTATQRLTPSQRASLVLMEVVGLSADEAAATLETTTASVNSALQRARRALRDVSVDDARAAMDDPGNRAAVERFADAFARYDLEAIAAMLRDDATMCMPPLALWLQGADRIAAWMGGRGAGCRGSRLVPTQANGRPAWAQYRPSPDGGHVPWALVVPIAHDGVVDQLHYFLNTDALFPRFGLPARLDADEG